MIFSPQSSDTANRYRQIGRKALRAERIARSINSSMQAKPKRSWRLPHLTPKVIALLCALVVIVGVAGFAVQRYYHHQALMAQIKADIKRQGELRAKSMAADACRRKKAEQKADLIGKITYDELYDYGECDK